MDKVKAWVKKHPAYVIAVIVALAFMIYFAGDGSGLNLRRDP